VAAEDAAIGVYLVQHDIAQPLEKPGPASVVGQDGGVEHVGIADDNAGGLSDLGPGRRGCIAVVGADGQTLAGGVPGRVKSLAHSCELGQLVLSQGLGGKEIEGGRVDPVGARRVGEETLEHRQIVAQRLPTSRGRNHHHVLALQRGLYRSGLVKVELLDAALPEGLSQPGVNVAGSFR
jgi:hypothetical protein